MLAIITLQHTGSSLDALDGDLLIKWCLSCRWWSSYFRKKCLDHQVHAADIEIHREVPVFLLTVQDGSVMDKTGQVIKEWGKMII